MRKLNVPRAIAALLLMGALTMANQAAAQCGSGVPFERWLDGVKREAAAAGISQNTIARSLDGITFDQSVVNADRRQRVFSQSFLEFSDRMVAQYRLDQGAKLLRQYSSTFSRIEQRYGVPGPVLASFWGLETDFGANIGKGSTLRSLASLAYDCRRPEVFRPQLLSALRIVERGDLQPHQMIGPWAGELGQTQFLPSHYVEYGVDFDGDGRRDLLRSAPDALASTANLLAAQGWRRGEPWLEEVRVPERMPWDQADLAILHPRSQWAQWGVQRANGGQLSADGMRASLLLPMGRNGPAFLAFPNFQVYLEWNSSLVYATTAAYFATRLAGAPRVSRGRGAINPLSYSETKELQQLLQRQGLSVGKVDGIIGEQTRAAVKAMQIRLGLAADSYPTKELLARMR
jgi:lytic murein transglycosylase